MFINKMENMPTYLSLAANTADMGLEISILEELS